MIPTGQKPFSELVVDLHRSLGDGSIPHAFGGALALAYYVVHPRATDNIDLNIAVSKHDARSVFEVLPVGVKWGGRQLRMAETQGSVRLRWFRGISVDLFFPKSEYERVVQDRAEWHRFAATELPFVSATDLAVLKATFDRGSDVAGKERDWTDLREMLEAQTPDVAEMLRWVERLHGRDSDALTRLRGLVVEIDRRRT